MNLNELLDGAARRWPDKPALIEGPTVLSYEGLVERISYWATRLKALRWSAGCRVGICFPNSIEYVAVTYALWRLNAVVVPIPIECAGEEMATIAETMQLEAILSATAIENEAATPLAPGCFVTTCSPFSRANNHGLNIAFIRFTSGTTSTRKGVVLTHETIYDRVLTANKALRIGPEDTVMWCLPMSHHFLITIVLYLSQGATTVLTRLVLADLFLEEAKRHQATILYGTPFQYALLAASESGPDLPSVRLAVSTTCALPKDVAAGFRKRFGFPLAQALGIIELGLVSLNTSDPDNRWNSVGRLIPDHQIKILDPDENGCGEIALNGPGFLDAYAAPWLPRDQVLDDGWFRTGDIGRVDADDYLFLAGRTTAVINLAGRKVFPEEIEAVLNRHPAVIESRVYGRAHPHLGEVVEAEVVLSQPDADPQSVRDFCRANLAAYKVPTRLHVVTVLPRTAATGKIRRAAAAAYVRAS